MGNKVILIFIVFTIFNMACNKEEKDEMPNFPLSSNAKKWFSKSPKKSIFFNSDSGLSEGYRIDELLFTGSGTFNGKKGYGETYIYMMDASIGDGDFEFAICNIDNPEYIKIEYRNFEEGINTAYRYQIEPPYKLIDYYSSMGGKKCRLDFIGDTTINGTRYGDIFINYALNDPLVEICISQSLGLIAYKTIDSTVWYRN